MARTGKKDRSEDASRPRSGFRRLTALVSPSLENMKPRTIEEALEGKSGPAMDRARGELERSLGVSLYEELRGLASVGRSRVRAGGPKVLILPGIMGSTLGYRGRFFLDDVIWIDPIGIARGRLMELKPGTPSSSRIAALGSFPPTYLPLKLRLRWAGFDVEDVPFDWRLGIRTLGHRLLQRIRSEQADRLVLVAHSMGGLVARAALALAESDRAVHDRIAHLIMLGTPNHGSFSAVQVLRNQHEIVQRVGWLDFMHDTKTLVEEVVNQFPSLYEMLPTPSAFDAVDLYDPNAWPLGDEVLVPRPVAALLNAARETQKWLGGANPHPRSALIAGIKQETIVALRVVGGEFEYLTNEAGDGTVPLAMARLDGSATFHVEEEHGSLPGNRLVTDAIRDLILEREPSLPTTWTPRLPPRAAGRPLHERSILAETRRPNQAARPPAREPNDPFHVRNLLRGFANPTKLAESPPDAATPR